MKNIQRLGMICLLTILPSAIWSQNIQVDIAPAKTKAIRGISQLNRQKYINLSDPGGWFEGKATDKGGADYFLDSLNITFGNPNHYHYFSHHR
ncbi:MAG: hypothetical protein AAF206_26130, partial [Bacteroidota bacterium]